MACGFIFCLKLNIRGWKGGKLLLLAHNVKWSRSNVAGSISFCWSGNTNPQRIPLTCIDLAFLEISIEGKRKSAEGDFPLDFSVNVFFRRTGCYPVRFRLRCSCCQEPSIPRSLWCKGVWWCFNVCKQEDRRRRHWLLNVRERSEIQTYTRYESTASQINSSWRPSSSS